MHRLHRLGTAQPITISNQRRQPILGRPDIMAQAIPPFPSISKTTVEPDDALALHLHATTHERRRPGVILRPGRSPRRREAPRSS